MRITLSPYSPAHDEALLSYIVAFFVAHHARAEEVHPQKIIHEWTAEDHEFYEIHADGDLVGFLHTCMRGPVVCWIEDVFVDEHRRGQGIASQAITLMEEALRQRGVEGVCMDVVPDNLPALRLYHRLGYDRLSLVTVRKDMQPFASDRTETIAGLPFRVKRFDE